MLQQNIKPCLVNKLASISLFQVSRFELKSEAAQKKGKSTTSEKNKNVLQLTKKEVDALKSNVLLANEFQIF